MLCVSKKLLSFVLIVHGCKPHDRECSECHIEELIKQGFVQCLAREHREEAEPEERQHEEYILVEVVAYKIRIPSIGLSSMNEEKRL